MSEEEKPGEGAVTKTWAVWSLALFLGTLSLLAFVVPWQNFFCILSGFVWISALWCRRGLWALGAVFALLFALDNNSHFLNFFQDRYFSVLLALIGIYSVLICFTWLRCRDKLDPGWAWSGVIILSLFSFGMQWSGPWSTLPSLLCLIFAVLFWLLSEQKILAAALVASLFGPIIHISPHISLWHMVVVSFFLLALGYAVSLSPKTPTPESGAGKPMVEKERPKSGFPGSLPSPSFIKFTAVGFILLILVAMLLPTSGPSPIGYQKSMITRCKNNLKQLGLSINSYYSDSSPSAAMPTLKSFEVRAANDGGYGFDANMLSCSADHKGPCLDYVWNPKISGSTWAVWNNSNSPLIWDATPHKYKGKINVLFGDGHVEEMTPERLKELTR